MIKNGSNGALMNFPPETAELLVEKAKLAQQNAHCPYSEFPVGAALLIKALTGEEQPKIFLGANVENVSYGGTICAERSAICSAVSQLGPKQVLNRIGAIAIVANLEQPTPPCGLCRQVLVEFGDFPVILHSAKSGRQLVTSVRDLMPLAFVPSDLIEPSEQSKQQKQQNGNNGVQKNGAETNESE